MQGWIGVPQKMDGDHREHLGLDSQERGELQLPNPCEEEAA